MASATKAWRLAAALALAALTAPHVLAQTTDRPFAGRTEAEILEYLRAKSTDPGAAPQLDAMVGQMLAPGSVAADWNTKAVDVIAVLGAMKGGLAGNLLVTEGGQLAISRLDGEPFPAGILAGYSTLEVRSSTGAAVNQRLLSKLAPGFWIEVAVSLHRNGNALCNKGVAEVKFHTQRPAAQWTGEQAATVAMVIGFYDRMAMHEVCEVYTATGSGFAAVSYLPDGTRIPATDAGPQKVVASRELAALVKRAR
jgi:hypothetical protein